VIIQVVLMAGLAAALVFAVLQRRASSFVASISALASVAGMYFVLLPDQANRLAHYVGVGRGADLILYVWLVISLVVSVHLHIRLLRQQRAITALARELAIRSATREQGGNAPGQAAATDAGLDG
jgi:hypothetical protein